VTTLEPLAPGPPARRSQNYAALRELALERIQKSARETWTDHNVHDPGITILEAFCYAVTELGLRVELPIVDLLKSSQGDARAALPEAFRVLSSGPVTFEDLRRVVLDHHRVSTVQLAQAVGEVPLYERPGETPPLGYTPSAARVVLQGMSEAVAAFSAVELNSNSYTTTTSVGGQTVTLDMALPAWDEPEAEALRHALSITAVQMIDLPEGGPWRRLDEPQSFFGQLRVDYALGTGPAQIVLWVVLVITDELSDPAVQTPPLLSAAEVFVEAIGASGLVARFLARVRAAQQAVREVSGHLVRWRNLSEDPTRLVSVRQQEIAVRARLEVAGSVNLEELLSDIFLRIDAELSPAHHFHSLAEMRAKGRSLPSIFDGPILDHGFLEAGEVEQNPVAPVLFTSDILRLMLAPREGQSSSVAQENPSGREVVAVTDLGLSNFINNRPITVNATDCLHLVSTDRYQPQLSLAKSRIVFVRDEMEVSYDRQRVEALFLERRAALDAATTSVSASPVLAPLPAERLPVAEYYSFQNELPHTFAVGDVVLGPEASRQRQAQSLQAKAYLMLFDQLLSDLTGQLGSINRFFSPDPAESSSYFPVPSFELPEAEKLIRSFPPGGDWGAFVQDTNNPHRQLLQTSLESHDQFLDRRNRMLDHLLARQGEEAVAWGQELHRWGRAELLATNPPGAQLAALLLTRQQRVNARLVRDKGAFLKDLPELNRFKLRASSRPWDRLPSLIQLGVQNGQHSWALATEARVTLRSAQPSSSRAEASQNAEAAFVLAASLAAYSTSGGGQAFRYQVTRGDGQVVAISADTFTTSALAISAGQANAASFERLLVEESLSTLERRVRYLTGIRSQRRKPLAEPLPTLFEIVNAAGGAKSWRLWDSPARASIMLQSPGLFTAPTEAEATQLAQAALLQVQRFGSEEWNYSVAPGATTLTLRLFGADGGGIGVRTGLGSQASAEQALADVAALLNEHFSYEGFHLVEHLMLRPRARGERLLSLPREEGRPVVDPYSHRLSFVFPSGFARASSAAAPSAAAPHRFRDPEFRRHVERTVQQACPAHLLPAIYWVDRVADGAVVFPESFEGFEQRYLGWVRRMLFNDTASAAATDARQALVEALNALAAAHA
jgi:hypothetical protein